VCTTSLCVNNESGNTGSFAQLFSQITKRYPNRKEAPNSRKIRASFHGMYVPPSCVGRRKAIIQHPSSVAPRKSTRLSRLPLVSGAPLAGFSWGISQNVRRTLIIINGTWPRNDQRQPIESASRPPTGPPKLLPAVAAMFAKLLHVATSRIGTRSKSVLVISSLDQARQRVPVMSIETKAVMPAAPIPEIILPNIMALREPAVPLTTCQRACFYFGT